MNIPFVIAAVSALVAITVLCLVLYYSKETSRAAARTQLHLKQVEANLAELQKVRRSDIPYVTSDAVCTRMLLVFPHFPDDQGMANIVGWKLPAGKTLDESLSHTFWGDAAKKLSMTVMREPIGYIPPAKAEFYSWERGPAWFRATISSDEAEKLIAECGEPVLAPR